MGYKEGEDLTVNFKYPFQHFNRIKNHWRQSDPKSALTDAQPGMIASDSDDEKLWHKRGDSVDWDEVLQEQGSYDAKPHFAQLTLDVDLAAITEPPTDAELDGIYTSPATLGNGGIAFVKNSGGTGIVYMVVSDGIFFWTFAGTKAV